MKKYAVNGGCIDDEGSGASVWKIDLSRVNESVVRWGQWFD